MPKPVSRTVSFAQEVKPILEKSCLNCHGRGRDKGGFRLDTRETLLVGGDSGAVVVPGDSSGSRLIQLVAGVDPDNVMPRKGSRLTAEQVGILRGWIDQGIPWDSEVSFARSTPRNLRPQAPKFSPTPESTVSPLDQLLKPYFQQTGFAPPAVVSDAVFCRRASLDLVGLLPTPEELERFVNNPSPAKREEWARELLSRKEQYAEHWLSFWNDLLRNDYRGTGYIDGGRKQITPWLHQALLTNMPYTRFVSELVNPTPASEGFINGIVWRGVVNSSQTPAMQAAQNISQVFMGVNLKCASCHDSFINEWRLADSYGLASVYSEGPLEMFQCDKPTGKKAEARFIYPELGALDGSVDRGERLKRLAELITGPQDGRLTRTVVNRLWGRFFGRALVEPVDDMEQAAWNQDVLDCLAEDLATNHYDLKKTMERIVTSRAYQLPAVASVEAGKRAYQFRGPEVRRLSAEQFRDALAQLTGVWFERPELAEHSTNAVRASLVPADALATALGRPNREQVCTARLSMATTLQALELANGTTLSQLLERGAERLLADNPHPGELIPRLYQAALGRAPNAAEAGVARELAGQPMTKEGLEDLLWAVSMLPEFQFIY